MGADNNTDSEKKTIMAAYGMLCLTLICGFIPTIVFCALALILFTLITPVAGYLRRKAAPESLTANHMTWIIRTVWVVTIMAGVLLAAGSAYVLSVYDPGPLQACVDKIMAAAQAGQEPGYELLLPCVPPFLKANQWPFLIAGLGAAVPVVLCLLWRLTKGIARARRGERIDNVKSWL